MDFDFKQSKSGRLRGSMCDHESHLGFGFYKNVCVLRPTYQIRLFAYRAAKENKFLKIKVPDICQLSQSFIELQNNVLTKDGQQRIRILRIK